MNYQIHIQDLTLEARVGIHGYEQDYQPIILNLTLEVYGKTGEDYDAIKHTVDYEEVITNIKKLLITKKFQLLETLSTNIADMIIDYSQVKKVTVNAGKPHLLNSNRLSVTITRKKNYH